MNYDTIPSDKAAGLQMSLLDATGCANVGEESWQHFSAAIQHHWRKFQGKIMHPLCDTSKVLICSVIRHLVSVLGETIMKCLNRMQATSTTLCNFFDLE